MVYTLTTTGAVGTITLEDLGGLVFNHPTTVNLEDVASVSSIVQSLTNGDLFTLITAGSITVDAPTSGGPAAVVSKSYRSIVRDWFGFYPSTEGGQNTNLTYSETGGGSSQGLINTANGRLPGTYDFEVVIDLIVSVACTVTLGLFKRNNVSDPVYTLMSPGTLPTYAPTERVFTLPVGKHSIWFRRVVPDLVENDSLNYHIKSSINAAAQIVTISTNFTPVNNPEVQFVYLNHDI